MPSHHHGSELSRRRFLAGGAACAGALAGPSLIGERQAAAATQYSLTVVNNSNEAWDFFLFQEYADASPAGLKPLAWLTKYMAGHNTGHFSWDLGFSFVWAPTGPLGFGSGFTASERVAADPTSPTQNQIRFGTDTHTEWPRFMHGSAAPNPQRGFLYIRQLGSVPTDTVSVGIGQAGSPVFAVQASPSKTTRFTPPDGRYVIAAGTSIETGDVLDLDGITQRAAISFDGTFAMQATFNADHTWTVTD
ncbi:hypothetical protein [Streptomyces sp. NBC_01353]|uniref:hypothetical protein n=1 Tax=Streptomyces sp. NBC_01353 TaxID=2903835 RepID=UPI002E344780|nr:hypothetical protein [Streptomyces sp. NBC_01353]